MNSEPFEDERIVKRMKIVFDGKQYLVRFPKEISDLLNLSGYKIKFELNVPKEGEITSSDLLMEMVK